MKGGSGGLVVGRHGLRDLYMVLVYTDSKERAMRLAVCLDGVVLKDKQKIHFGNYASLCGSLERDISSEGFVRAFFQGKSYIFIYSNGTISVPWKMADYDPAYASIMERPVPFLPEKMERKMVDEGFESKLSKYRSIYRDCEFLINAAADSYEGELHFLQFFECVRDADNAFEHGSREVMRVKPRTMTPDDVVRAFIAPDVWSDGIYGATAAAIGKEYLEWTLACNATNALYQANPQHRMMAVGRMESAVLTLIAEQDKTARAPSLPAQKNYSVNVKLTLPKPYSIHGKREVEARVSTTALATEKEASAITDKLRSAGAAEVVSFERIPEQAPAKLLNLASLQVRAMERFGIPMQETMEAVEWLYLNGFISWPTTSDSNPWDNKPHISKAVYALTDNPLYAGKIIPRDIESYLLWDKTDQLYESASGILITDVPFLPKTQAPKNCGSIYQIIADAVIDTFKAAVYSDTVTVSLSCAGYKLVLMDRKSEICAAAPQPDTPLPSGLSVKITDATASLEAGTPPYTVKTIIECLCALGDGKAYWNSGSAFRSAIENLIVWGQITQAPETDILSITDLGRAAYRYLSNTDLSDIAEIIGWDQRLGRISRGHSAGDSGGAPRTLLSDIGKYVTEISTEIRDVCEEMRQHGGLLPSEMVCPLCGEPLSFPAEGGCVCSSCGKFKIPDTLFGHKMTNADIAALLQRGSTPLIEDFSSAKGLYAARILLADGKLSRSFLSPYACPQCGKPLNEYSWGLKCSSTSCKFSLKREICGCRLTEEDIETLLRRQKTRKLNMVSGKGNPFSTRLSLAEDGSVAFEKF